MDTTRLLSLVPPASPDHWYVSDGATSVGPVSLDLLARGVAAGKVPVDGFVRHSSWPAWRGLGDLIEGAPSFDPRRTFRMMPAARISQPRVAQLPPQSTPHLPPRPLARIAPRPEMVTLDSVELEDDDDTLKPGTSSTPTPRPSSLDAMAESIDASWDRASALPSSPSIRDSIADIVIADEPSSERQSPPDRAFEGASDLSEARLVLLSLAVAACDADAALVHAIRADGVSIVCSHGEGMLEHLGVATGPRDPALAAAREGQSILAEPVPGAIGRAIRTRLSTPSRPAIGGFMVPVRVGDELVAMLEVGRRTTFRGRDLAAVEALVDAFVSAIEMRGWARNRLAS